MIWLLLGMIDREKAVTVLDDFSCSTRILSGPGAVSALKELGGKRVFVVTDPFFFENGTAARIAGMAEAEATEIFSQVRPDPTVELVAEGTARLKAFGADMVVALGGGVCAWGGINLLEGYGNDNPGAKSQGVKQLMAGAGIAIIGLVLIPQLATLITV